MIVSALVDSLFRSVSAPRHMSAVHCRWITDVPATLGLEASTTTDTEESSLVMSQPELVYAPSLTESVTQRSELVTRGRDYGRVVRPSPPTSILSDSLYQWTANPYLDLPDEV